ncbi:hypothetical protein DASC09_018300 [Saccharomycopsis crataegensis]|uniref:Zn(2)-C6 fungal-type domain-containing protein n=1 Tax=Saccharomycopsis crataegensis TaxID=43959 RepID=A0AAV5QJF7_9ASCO|nr:hypothetical protein DASC09_018300 [Saccharomycopsis crataegensis]
MGSETENRKLREDYRKKRRIVPDNKRKRALFSCDRCKQRKIKCNRVKISDSGELNVRYDNTTSCINCVKASAECITQLPRKKRMYYHHVDKLEFHFQILESLLTGLHPEIDVSDLNQLIKFGNSKGIDMPDYEEFLSKSENSLLGRVNKTPVSTSSGNTKAPKNDIKNLLHPENTQVITSDNRDEISEKSNSGGQENNSAVEIPKMNDYAVERLVYDMEGNSHYIGYASSFALFNGVCSLVMRNSRQTRLTFDNHVHTYQTDEIKRFQNRTTFITNKDISTTCIGEVPILSMASDHLPLWIKFPGVSLISKEEADFYVEIFFNKIHPYYFIFSEDAFREKYKQFWLEIASLENANAMFDDKTSESERYKKILEIREISSNWIFCIYLVWILGARFKPYPGGELNENLIDMFLNLIKLGLPGIILKSSLMSIRVLYLLAIDLFASKNKNSAWILIGLACRQAISLGLHRESGVLNLKYKRPISLRKQIWWSLYIFEVTLGISFGRPSIILNKDISISYPTDLYTRPGEEDFLSYYLETIKLTKLLNEIYEVRGVIYNEKDQSPYSLKVITKTLSIRKKLIEFKENLKAKRMSFEAVLEDTKNEFYHQKIKSTYGVKRYRLDLTMNYHCYMVIMSLPFILYTVNMLVAKPEFLGHLDEPIIAILTSGIESAIELSKCLHIYNELDFLEGNLFSDLFFGYTSTMVLVLVFLMLRSFKIIEKRNITNMTAVQYLRDQLKIYDNQTPVDSNIILSSVYRTRVAMNSGKINVGETMQRSLSVTEDLLRDIGLVRILDKLFGLVEKSDSEIPKSKTSDNPIVDEKPNIEHGIFDNLDINPKFFTDRAKKSSFPNDHYNDIVENNYKDVTKLKEVPEPVSLEKEKMKNANVASLFFSKENMDKPIAEEGFNIQPISNNSTIRIQSGLSPVRNASGNTLKVENFGKTPAPVDKASTDIDRFFSELKFDNTGQFGFDNWDISIKNTLLNNMNDQFDDVELNSDAVGEFLQSSGTLAQLGGPLNNQNHSSGSNMFNVPYTSGMMNGTVSDNFQPQLNGSVANNNFNIINTGMQIDFTDSQLHAFLDEWNEQ